jgi:hypothetical protein
MRAVPFVIGILLCSALIAAGQTQDTASNGATVRNSAEDDEPPRLSRGKPKPRAKAAILEEAEPSEKPPPSDFLARARGANRRYFETLPNFVCEQITTRYKREHEGESWVAGDTIIAELMFNGGKEEYRNIKVGGRPASNMMDLNGQRSVNEYGTLVQNLMDSDTHAQFKFVRQDRLRGRNAALYDFEVDGAHSIWHISYDDQAITPGYRGTVWIDRETARVLRLEQQAKGIPPEFQEDVIELTMNYDFAEIGGNPVLLPAQSENLTCERGSGICRKNVISFRAYQEFTSDSKIDFAK